MRGEPPRPSSRAVAVLALVWVFAVATLPSTVGCGATGTRERLAAATGSRDVEAALRAYEGLRDERSDPDLEALQRIAAIVLEAEVMRTDELRDRVFDGLIGTGSASQDLLERLARRGGMVGLRAMAALAAQGDLDYDDRLRLALGAQEGEARAAGMESLREADAELPTLTRLSSDPEPDVRAKAATRLAATAPDVAALLVLGECVRLDPEADVRATCARALGRFGREGAERLRERLADPDARVRRAVAWSLGMADGEVAAAALAGLLSSAPTAEGIEGARALAIRGDAGARAYLRTALAAGSPEVRGHAALALLALSDDGDLDVARLIGERLGAETDEGLKVLLAEALLRREQDHAESLRILRAAVASSSAPSHLHASGVLVRRGDAAARRALDAATREGSSTRRASAIRLLAFDARGADAIRRFLLDPDERVRLTAALAMFRAES
ncbi:MAG: HEAT repeat domain-containing protein [Deltaproteobacteria bacterium]|nr:HEAT repeat domain-containing protein [Deltaproteobacteria bacterium]